MSQEQYERHMFDEKEGCYPEDASITDDSFKYHQYIYQFDTSVQYDETDESDEGVEDDAY